MQYAQPNIRTPEERAQEEKAAANLMSRARTQLILRQPFFGQLAMRLKFRPTWDRPTAATDGRRLLYNPGFILMSSPNEIMGIIAHEIMHCCLEHHKRRGNRDPLRWNIAGDIVINPLVAGDGSGLELGEGALMPSPEERGLSTEQVYDRIKTPPRPPEPPEGEPDPDADPEDGEGDGSGSGFSDAPQDEDEPGQDGAPGSPADLEEDDLEEDDLEEDDLEEDEPGDGRREIDPDDYKDLGEVLDDPGPDPDDPDPDDAQDWTSAALAARTFAQGRGNMPQAIDAAITAAIRPTYSLNDLVRQFVLDTIRADYSWRRPNRNYFPRGLRAPSIETPEPGRIAVFIDVSGSISEDQVLAALDAVSGLADDLRAPVRVICCNSGITFDKEFGPGEVIQIPAGSGGGTDFNPPFSAIAQDPEPPACIIYISADMDGFMPRPESEPPCPVLWISEPLDHDPQPPFGQWHGIQTPPGGRHD